VLALAAVLGGPALAQTPPPLPGVLVQEAQKRTIGQQAEFIGRVQAVEKVELRARVQGFLGPRLFEDGADVKVGQTLFTIERDPFVAALDQRKAQLASAQATLLNAQAQLARYRTLEAKDAASVAQLDQRIAEEARARASVLEAEAAVKDAEIQLSYTEIKAPIAGRIGRTAVTPGNLVGTNSGVLATIVRLDQMYVLFPITQRELLEARRQVGDKPLTVRARLADGSLFSEPGKIDFIDVQVDPRTDGQIVRALFANKGDALTDGQTIRLVIELAAPDEVIAIPMAAVATDQAGQFVYVVGKDNAVEQRRVQLGPSRDGAVTVKSGVAVGDRVIVQGQQRVRPGAKVNPQPMPVPAQQTKQAIQ
jgi:membrane fusion protein (multidrug efflux system)